MRKRAMRALKERAQRAGVHVHAAAPDALMKLVGDVVHQGAVAAMRPLKGWDEHDLTALARSAQRRSAVAGPRWGYRSA